MGTDVRMILDIGVWNKPRGDINIDVQRTSFCNLIASAEHLPLKDSSFDLILCTQVLEHLDDPLCGLREIKRVATKEGTIILDFPKPFFMNNLRYKFLYFILNLPFSLFPKAMRSLYESVRGISNREPTYYHKSAITPSLVSSVLDVREQSEMGDIFQSKLRCGRKSKMLRVDQWKPKIYSIIRLICQK